MDISHLQIQFNPRKKALCHEYKSIEELIHDMKAKLAVEKETVTDQIQRDMLREALQLTEEAQTSIMTALRKLARSEKQLKAAQAVKSQRELFGEKGDGAEGTVFSPRAQKFRTQLLQSEALQIHDDIESFIKGIERVWERKNPVAATPIEVKHTESNDFLNAIFSQLNEGEISLDECVTRLSQYWVPEKHDKRKSLPGSTFEQQIITSVTQFLSAIKQQLSNHTVWKDSDDISVAHREVGKLVLSRLSKVLWQCIFRVNAYADALLFTKVSLIKRYTSNTARLQKLMKVLHAEPSLPQIKENDVVIAATELRKIQAETSPYLHLQVLQNTCNIVAKALQFEKSDIGADEFLPNFVLVVLQAEIPHLRSYVEFIENFCDKSRTISGNSGYCFASLYAACEIVSGLDLKSCISPRPIKVKGKGKFHQRRRSQSLDLGKF
eukprot:g6039.t1